MAPIDSIDTMAEAPFYIASPVLRRGRDRTLKHANTFAVFDSHGDMGASTDGTDGLFDHDTRYLSRFEILIDGMEGGPRRPDARQLAAERGRHGVNVLMIDFDLEAPGLERFFSSGGTPVPPLAPQLHQPDGVPLPAAPDGVDMRLEADLHVVPVSVR